jgi:uncharacterized protein YigE (DUF2233 family)
MFVAEPKDQKNQKARIVDTRREKLEYHEWNSGVQSWPMLVHNGQPNRNLARQRDYRTLVGMDRNGNLIAATTEGNYFSLTELSKALSNSGLNLVYALNLDGGHAAQMSVRSSDVDYETYGKEEGFFNIPILDAFVEQVNIPIPGVIGVFKR